MQEDEKRTQLYEEILKLKELSHSHDNISTIKDVWLTTNKQGLVFITDYYFGGSIRGYINLV